MNYRGELCFFFLFALKYFFFESKNRTELQGDAKVGEVFKKKSSFVFFFFFFFFLCCV